jgi:hypothetical protein
VGNAEENVERKILVRQPDHLDRPLKKVTGHSAFLRTRHFLNSSSSGFSFGQLPACKVCAQTPRVAQAMRVAGRGMV